MRKFKRGDYVVGKAGYRVAGFVGRIEKYAYSGQWKAEVLCNGHTTSFPFTHTLVTLTDVKKITEEEAEQLIMAHELSL